MPTFDPDTGQLVDNEDDLPKSLRKQIAEKDKALKELNDKFEAIAKRDRARTLTDVFTEKGLPVKAAKFFPADQEATPEAVDAWIAENADVFGLKPVDDKAQKPPEESATPGVLDAYKRLQAITQPNAAAGGEAEALHAVNNATEAELLALIKGAGGGGLY